MITPLDKLSPIVPLDGERTGTAPQVSEIAADNPFASVFRSAIENVRVTDAEKTEAEYLLSTGQLDNPAQLTILAAKNQIAVDLLVQLRNRALDAYSELTRISM